MSASDCYLANDLINGLQEVNGDEANPGVLPGILQRASRRDDNLRPNSHSGLALAFSTRGFEKRRRTILP